MSNASASDRTARARLDADVILEAGLDLASTGVPSISVRELGTRLGSDPTAIYRHFRSKEALMAALLDELNARAVASVDVPADDWQGRLRALAESTLDWYTRHPAIAVEATSLTTHGAGELTAVELMLDAFHRAGLRDAELVRHYALMATHVLSVTAGIARSHAERQGTGTSTDTSSWFDAPLLADPRTFPLIAANSAALTDLQDRDLFLMGVDLIIESAARTAAS
ncbi:TetR/AcrR family transcriptional regulator [Microbacterium esteraromaticum]|uniref:TetR/AcrR family transcriptional regulator n=1 Tax=Microbacterium esteraromaticum TaxID=57043 RepID=UPI0019584800|nr:TetR/AcrR family transcriptional regulator C-terminal domain-containing protein [Microbacterium esteraromaticum]MBM7465618.1 AcrR family transcriptional regulator [Microbacterium esteraromaticum]